jgi:hypothetical protein
MLPVCLAFEVIIGENKRTIFPTASWVYSSVRVKLFVSQIHTDTAESRDSLGAWPPRNLLPTTSPPLFRFGFGPGGPVKASPRDQEITAEF